MSRHSFDPVSAALGVLALVAGLLVAVGAAGSLDTPWLITGAAIVMGVALIPWQRLHPDRF